MITLNHYLAVGAILFTIGVLGIFLNRRNVILMLMAIELILLVAMGGAIVLTLHHKRDVRRQSVSEQVGRTREKSVELAHVESGRGLS